MSSAGSDRLARSARARPMSASWYSVRGRITTGARGAAPGGVWLASSDDASSHVFARFSAYEGTLPAMASCQRYVQR